MSRVAIKATILHQARPHEDLKLVGRVAWTAYQLVRAGPRGCTPIEQPAPRWSDYVFRLRGLGVIVETIHEPHGGQFSGNHARYVLRSRLRLSGKTIKEWCGEEVVTGGNPKPVNTNASNEVAA